MVIGKDQAPAAVHKLVVRHTAIVIRVHLLEDVPDIREIHQELQLRPINGGDDDSDDSTSKHPSESGRRTLNGGQETQETMRVASSHKKSELFLHDKAVPIVICCLVRSHQRLRSTQKTDGTC